MDRGERTIYELCRFYREGKCDSPEMPKLTDDCIHEQCVVFEGGSLPSAPEKLREEVANFIKAEASAGYLEFWAEYRKSLSQEQQDDYFLILAEFISSLFQSAQAEAVRQCSYELFEDTNNARVKKALATP